MGTGEESLRRSGRDRAKDETKGRSELEMPSGASAY